MTKTKLGIITKSIFDGKHGDCNDKNGSGLYFISVKDLTEYDIDYSNAREITQEDFAANYPRTNLENGDTIYANTGDTIGKSIFVKDNSLVKQTSFQKSVAVLKPNTEYVELRYLYYLLKYLTPALRNASTGSAQKNLLLSTLRDFDIEIHPKEKQKKIVDILGAIDDKIRCNIEVCTIIEKSIQTIYSFWFEQFEFPDKNSNPYKSSGGNFFFNEELKRDIPMGWKVENLAENTLSSIIKPGIDKFVSKNYLATGNVVKETITDGEWITYDNREGRANMQPISNSVWFAKMKNSIKHISLPMDCQWFIDKYILSTGFCGLSCSSDSFAYIHSIINSLSFEVLKDKLSHGATQEGVNNDDLKFIKFVVPDDNTLRQFGEKINPLLQRKLDIMKENQELASLRDFLLPLLMNGQVVFKEDN